MLWASPAATANIGAFKLDIKVGTDTNFPLPLGYTPNYPKEFSPQAKTFPY